MAVDFFWRRAKAADVRDLGPRELGDLMPYWFDERFKQERKAGVILGVEDTGIWGEPPLNWHSGRGIVHFGHSRKRPVLCQEPGPLRFGRRVEIEPRLYIEFEDAIRIDVASDERRQVTPIRWRHARHPRGFRPHALQHQGIY